MAIETFGLRKSVEADPDRVRELLDKGDRILLEIISAMVDGVRNPLNDNSVRLGKVDQRLRSSINGHLRRNQALIKPVAAEMLSSVHNALDQNQAVVNVVSATPELQDAMRETPPVPAYGGAVPQLAPPAPTAPPAGPMAAPLSGPAPARPSALNPSAPPAELPGELAPGQAPCHTPPIPAGYQPIQRTPLPPNDGPWPAWTAILDDGRRYLYVATAGDDRYPAECAVSIGRLSRGEVMQWAQHYQTFVQPYHVPTPPPVYPAPPGGPGMLPPSSAPPSAPTGAPQYDPSADGGTGASINWVVYLHCATDQAALVPQPSQADHDLLSRQGWIVPSSVPVIRAQTPAEARMRLGPFMTVLQALCQQS